MPLRYFAMRHATMIADCFTVSLMICFDVAMLMVYVMLLLFLRSAALPL